MTDVYMAGTGIRSLSHLTQEFISVLKDSDVTIFLLNEPLLVEYIKENSKSYINLESIYYQFDRREDSYSAISDVIVEQCKGLNKALVAAYGHPYYCASPFLLAAKKLSEQGERVMSLASISSLDCLISELMFDPLADGLQVYEATQLLLSSKKIDHSSNLILTQVGFMSHEGHTHMGRSDKSYNDLITKLAGIYDCDHVVALYESALYPSMKSEIRNCAIEELREFKPSTIATLYIPPLHDECARL